MAWVELADGQSLYVRVMGRGRPVLMLPGLGMSSHQWLPFVLPLCHKFSFYMPDFRGHGRSRQVTLPHADVFQTHADDTLRVIEHFQLQDYALVGISLGATTAMHLERDGALPGASRYLHIDQSPCVLNDDNWQWGLCGRKQPQLLLRIESILALVHGYADRQFVDQLPQPVRLQLSAQLAELAQLLEVSARAQWMVKRLLPTLPAWVLRRVPLMRLSDLTAYLQAYSGGGYDYRPTLGRSGIPVTVMIGARSALYAAEGQRLVAASAAVSETVVFMQSGHVPLVDEPRKFLREFRRFLVASPSAATDI